jgi:hypothetical protein
MIRIERRFADDGIADEEPYEALIVTAERSEDRLDFLRNRYGCKNVSASGEEPVVVEFFDQDAGWIRESHHPA